MPKQPKCKACGRTGHYKTWCRSAPRKPIKINKKTVNRTGKQYDLWNACRRDWIQKNTTESGYWHCHYCGEPLTIETLTLDHRLTRSERPDLRYEHSNLMPCCALDNSRRGSMKYEKYLQMYYPETYKNLIDKSTTSMLR